ncbi:MAG: [citrate (pro-3S)-lyase] ligase [Tissierellia bacterium]|nr:[citrate (pro-3S)-lyase] ligase [Tissierellia bacterium]
MIEYKIANYRWDRDRLEDFLQDFQLKLEEDVEYSIIAYDNDRIVGTGSVSKNVLKCFAIDPNYQGYNITGTIVTKLMEYEAERGIFHLFIFTKPENKKIFSSLGFKEVAMVEDVCLLDNNIETLKDYLEELKPYAKKGNIATIVMNANPMTKGHLALVQKASQESDYVHLFLVREDSSVFPFKDRYHIVKESVKDLKNVFVHPGNEYIISKNTFPTYFYKDENIVIRSYSELDLKIFCEYFAKTLYITKRYVGTEPLDIVTRTYNEAMKEILPKYGIELEVVERFKESEELISASKVRTLLRDNNLSKAFSYLPEATIEYLKSEQGQKIMKEL